MKKFFTLVAAAFMAVSVSAANKVLKITGTADNPGEAYSRQCFINLKNLEKGKAYVVKFDVYTSSDTEFEIGTEAIDDSQTEHKDQWNNSAVFSYTEGLTITKDRKEVAVHFPGKTTVDCATHNDKLENFEYAASALLLNIGKLPKDAILYIDNVKVYDEESNLLYSEDFENATVAAYDKTKTAYYLGWQEGANFEIADENATYISSVDLANVDYTADDATAAGGWGNGFESKIEGGACVISHGKTTDPWEAQVNFENVYPKGATIKLSMEVKGSVEGSIAAGLQNPNGYKDCGNFPEINLTTDYKKVDVSTMCSGEGAKRLLLNLGKYAGTVSIKNLKIVAERVKQESLTIPSSSFATYAASYPVDYDKLGLEAYAVKLNNAKDGVEFTKISGVVPAGVPVLLKGTADKEYALNKADGWSPVSTDLKASDGTSASTDAATLYALSTVDGVTAFYPVKQNSAIPAKRCYLEVNGTSAKAAFFSLGTNFGETTGISSVENKVEKADAPVYNLAGQLVGKDYKGLVIKNGKKFVIK